MLKQKKSKTKIFTGCERVPSDHSEHGGGENHEFAEIQDQDGQHGHLKGQLQSRVDGKRTNFRTFFTRKFEQKVVEKGSKFWFR